MNNVHNRYPANPYPSFRQCTTENILTRSCFLSEKILCRVPTLYIIHYFTLMYKCCTLFVHYWSCNTYVHKVSSGKRCSHWYGCLLSSLSAAHRQGGGNVTRQLPVTCSFLNCGAYPSVLWLLVYNSNRQYTCSLGCFSKYTFQPKIKGIPSCIPPGYI